MLEHRPSTSGVGLHYLARVRLSNHRPHHLIWAHLPPHVTHSFDNGINCSSGPQTLDIGLLTMANNIPRLLPTSNAPRLPVLVPGVRRTIGIGRVN